MRYFITLFFIFYSSFNYAQLTKIIVWESLYNNPTPIMMDYLHKALQLTKPEYGDYELIASAKMEQGRSVLELAKLKNTKLDLASYGSTKEREEQAIPIRIPLLSGLMGYRLCLIDKNKQALFDNIKNKQQLIAQNITMGQYQNSPDTTILRSSNIPVQTTHKEKLLFQQLARGRFDCLNRGVSEIYAEYLAHRNMGLSIENNLLLYYPQPMFFFVNKSRPLLARRLQLGLKKLIDSGEFETIFNHYFSPIIAKLKLDQRTIINLPNQTLSEQTIRALKTPSPLFRKNHLITQAYFQRL